MLKNHLRSIIFWVNLVGSLTVSVNNGETNDFKPTKPIQCIHTTAQSTGILYLSGISSFNNGTCLWKINVPNTDLIRVAIGYNKQVTTPFTKPSAGLRILFYNQLPNERSSPLSEWYVGDSSRVFTFPGNQLWIITAERHDTELLDAIKDRYITLSYLTQIDGTALNCDKSDIIILDDSQKDEGHIVGHRRLKIGNRGRIVGQSTFGSFSKLVCDEGFVLENGNGRLQCLAVNGGLAWASDGSTCVTTCRHPQQTPNSNISLTLGVRQGLGRKQLTVVDRRTLPYKEAQNHLQSIAEYTCQEPYFLKGEDRVHCGPDDQGIPRWLAPPPLCIIPDCSEPYKLTRPAGTIVGPSPPGAARLRSGSVVCSWEIIAPYEGYVSLTFRHVDLPGQEGTALSVFDTAGPRPVLLLRLTGPSGVVSVDSVTSRVLVTYRGPFQDVTNHRGFYVDYVTKSRRVRVRRNDDLDGVTQQDDDLTVAVDTSSDNLTTTDDTSVDELSDIPSATNNATTGISTLGNLMMGSTLSTLVTTKGLPVDVSTEKFSPTAPNSPSQSVDTSPVQMFSATSQTTNAPLSSPLPSVVDSWETDTPLEFTTDEVENVEITPDAKTDKTDYAEITAGQITEFIGQGIITHYPVTPSPITASPFSPLAKNLTAPVADDSNDDWKIAVGVVIPLLILAAALSVGYYCYRKRYPVRMIIGREFGKFSNPTYSRSKQVISLVREDADDFFTHRSTATLTLDEMNPVNRNINYDNPAFVTDERDGHDNDEEEERRFRERKAWLFKKDSAETPPINDYEGKTRSHVEIYGAENDGIKDVDTEALQMTPRALPRTKKLTRTRSVSIVSDTSLDFQPSESETSSASSEGEEEPLKEDKGTRHESNPNLEIAGGDGGSNYLRVSQMIFEQPTYEEVCAEYKARARTMSLDRAPPESRMRSYSVGLLRSARRHSLRGEVMQLEHLRTIANDTNLPQDAIMAVVDGEKLGQSSKSISSIISETSVIDASVLDSLPFEARERCLSLDSLNSNPHLVTDLDDVSTGSSIHDAEEAFKGATEKDVFRSSTSSDSSHSKMDTDTIENSRPPEMDMDSTEVEHVFDPTVLNITFSGDIMMTDSEISLPLPRSDGFKSDIFFFPNACISVDENTESSKKVESTTDPQTANLSGISENEGGDTFENKATLLKLGNASDFEDYKNKFEENHQIEDKECSLSSSSSGSGGSKYSESDSSSDGEDELHSYSFAQEDHETQMSQDVDNVVGGIDQLSPNTETNTPLPPLPTTPPPLELLHVTGVITAKPIYILADDDSNHFQFPPPDSRPESSHVDADQLSDFSSDTSDVNPRIEINGSSILRQSGGVSSDFEMGDESENEAALKIAIEDVSQILYDSANEDSASRQLRIRSSFSGPVSSELGMTGTFMLTPEDGESDDIDV